MYQQGIFKMTNKGGYVMKKKRIAVAMLAATMVLGAAPCAFAADQITVTVDGEKVNFEDQQPVNVNNRVMVPVRDVAEKMGWEVTFEKYASDTLVDGIFQDEHHIMIQKTVDVGRDLGRNFIYLTNITMETNSILVGNSGYYAEEEKLKATPVVQNGRTLLGVRDIAEGLHADVIWNSATQTVEIKTKPTEQFAYYKELLDYVDRYAEGTTESTESEKEKTDSLTFEEEQRQRTEKYAAEQNAKRDEIAEEVIRLTNAEREKAGLNPLEMDDSLMKAADVRVKEMGESFSHTRPDGRKFVTAVEEAGYPNSYVGENIAFGVGDAKSALSLWMYSEGHKQNILNPDYEKMGAAYIYDLDNEETYWIQIFAK